MTSIATLGSHCSLQVLKGAKEEGFHTVLVTKSTREKFYKRYNSFIDEYIVVDDFRERKFNENLLLGIYKPMLNYSR